MVNEHFNLGVNPAKQYLWNFQDLRNNIQTVFLVSGLVKSGKKVLLVKKKNLNFVLSRIEKLESLHVYSIQSGLDCVDGNAHRVKSAVGPKEIKITSVDKYSGGAKEFKRTQTSIRDFFGTSLKKASLGNPKSEKQEGFVQTSLKDFYHVKSRPMFTYWPFDCDTTIIMDSHEDEIDQNLEMATQDDTLLYMALEETEKLDFELVGGMNSQDDFDLYQVAESIDFSEIDMNMEFEMSSKDDALLNKAFEEMEKDSIDNVEDLEIDLAEVEVMHQQQELNLDQEIKSQNSCEIDDDTENVEEFVIVFTEKMKGGPAEHNVMKGLASEVIKHVKEKLKEDILEKMLDDQVDNWYLSQCLD